MDEKLRNFLAEAERRRPRTGSVRKERIETLLRGLETRRHRARGRIEPAEIRKVTAADRRGSSTRRGSTTRRGSGEDDTGAK